MRVLAVSRTGEWSPQISGVDIIRAPLEQAAAEARRGGYDAVLARVSGEEEERIEELGRFGVPVIAVLDAPDSAAVRRLVRLGVRDVLFGPSDDEIGEALRAATAAPVGARAASGWIIAVIGSQGGVGRSTVAFNLSLLLGERGTTVLVDLVPFYGILHVLADIEPSVTLRDVLGPSLTRDAVAQALIPYEGIRLLASPPSPEGLRLDAGAVDDLLGVLSGMADYVVVDTERLLLPEVTGVLDRAHLVLCLTRLTIPGLRNLKAYLQSFVHQHVPMQKVLVVGVAGPGAVGARQAEEIMGIEVVHILPRDPVAERSESVGVPVVFGAPRSRLGRSLAQLADLVLERLAAQGEGVG